MPNILFKLGSLDLSTYVRVNPDDKLDLGQGDHLEPAFSDSPFLEGQTLTSLHAKNKELHVPLFLHPSQAPYLQDPLNQLVALVNQALRPVTDFGQSLNVQWQNAQASNPTFFSVQFGRFEPEFNFRHTEKGWLAGILHLWTLPYAHTATERIIGTYAAPANQSGFLIPAASLTAAAAGGTIVGDVSPQFDLRMRTGSYTGDDGQLGIISALPIASYTPIIPIASFLALSASAAIYGASGAWASQFLAMDTVGGSQGQNAQGLNNSYANFSFALSPASVYAGDNRVLGLVRARQSGFGLRAFDSVGNPLGPTVMATALDGWQLVDYGVITCPPWMATNVITVQAYPALTYTASGIVSPVRAAPCWTKEHGPIFVVPNAYTLLELDWNSPVVTADGFDSGASGAVLLGGLDALGNSWINSAQAQVGSGWVYNGNSAVTAKNPSDSCHLLIGTSFVGDYEIEAVFESIPSGPVFGLSKEGQLGVQAVFNGALSYLAFLGGGASVGFQAASAVYEVKLVSKGTKAWGILAGPSGAFAVAASGVVASIGINHTASAAGGRVKIDLTGNTAGQATGLLLHGLRARILASSGHQSLDAFHLYQPNQQNTRMLTASGPDVVDLQQRQRGPLQAVELPVPSLGAGLFVASFNWDQGPANDLCNVDVRIRERFTYAR